MSGFTDFFNAYIEAMIWTLPEHDEGENIGPGDYFVNEDDLDGEGMKKLQSIARRFWRENKDAIARGNIGANGWSIYAQAGHDLWLTQNGHGTGFWDRPEIWGDDMDTLDANATALGEVYTEWSYEEGKGRVYVD